MSLATGVAVASIGLSGPITTTVAGVGAAGEFLSLATAVAVAFVGLSGPITTTVAGVGAAGAFVDTGSGVVLLFAKAEGEGGSGPCVKSGWAVNGLLKAFCELVLGWGRKREVEQAWR